MLTTMTIIGAGILGLVFGSFFNCVINADLRGRHADRRGNFLLRRSTCPKCGHNLSFWDLIPIFSFIFLRGRCRHCHQKISLQYPIVELATAVLFIFIVLHYFSITLPTGDPPKGDNYFLLIRDLFFVSILLILFVFDLKYGIIPDRISIPAIIVAIGFNIFLKFTTPSNLPLLEGGGGKVGEGILWLFLAILVGGGFFLVQYLISKGRWIGGGDIRLGVLMGAMLSWPNILIALFLAYVTGAIYGIFAIILKKKTLKSAVPFGAFLTVTTFVILFFGNVIIKWYLGLI